MNARLPPIDTLSIETTLSEPQRGRLEAIVGSPSEEALRIAFRALGHGKHPKNAYRSTKAFFLRSGGSWIHHLS